MDVIPDPKNLPVESMPWARAITKLVQGLTGDANGVQQRTGNILTQLQATVQALGVNVSNLTTKFNTAIASITFDASQVVSGVFSAARIPSIDQSMVTNVWTKGVNTGAEVFSTNVMASNNVTGLNVFAQSLTTNITATRVTLWGRTSDGYIATASSSELLKTNIVPAEDKVAAILSIETCHYQWVESVTEAKRRASLPKDDPDYDPDMHVSTEVGFMAQRLHEAGLWEYVVYDRNDDDSLKLDEKGNAVPVGVHYILWGVAQQQVLRAHQAEIEALTERILTLEAK